MSPLIDVTNTVIQEIDISNNDSCAFNQNGVIADGKKGDIHSENISKKCERESNTDTLIALTKCNKMKHKHSKKKKQCQTSNLNKSKSVGILSKTNKEDASNNRVPPICSDDFLYDSLESLFISTENKESSNVSNEKFQTTNETFKSVSNSNLTGLFNNVGPPSDTFTSTHQCIACGLELSSIENLANHLVKHIYEGLYAASWLNNAISTLLLPLSLNSNGEDSLSVPVETRVPVSSSDTLENNAGIDNSSFKNCKPQT